MSENLIEVSKLTAGYGKKAIVEDASFALAEGEIVSLIGPNGSGKTTILRSICGQLKPLNGQVFIKGKRLNDYSQNDLARLMAVVFTQGQIKEAISVRDVVSLGRYPYTGLLGKLSEEDEEIIAESMRATSVDSLADQVYTCLSDGQRQRVLLARALAQKPSIMLLDEPTTFLDVKYTMEFLVLLKTLSREQGFAVIMSLHELDFARQISDKLVTIKGNRVDRVGTPDEIFKDGYINDLFGIKVGSFDEGRGRAILWQEI